MVDCHCVQIFNMLTLREAVAASAGVSLLFCVTAITLGILALVGIGPTVLNLVALLGVGLSNLLSGTAISTRMLTTIRTHETHEHA
jgi:hypothetical protein